MRRWIKGLWVGVVLGLAGLFGGSGVLLAQTQGQTPPTKVPLWGRWEQRFTPARPADVETALTIELTSPAGKRRTVAGFWDGDKGWAVRFMPDEVGTWSYRSRATPPVEGLDGQSGRFTCEAAPTKNPLLKRGPVRVKAGSYHLEHADGTPFFWLGDTVWTGPAFSTKDDWAAYLANRQSNLYSVVQFNVVSPWRTARADREGRVTFTTKPQFRVNPVFFQQLDERLDAINDHGLVAAPVLLWALKKDDPGNVLSDADAVRLIRYQLARYGAHHVVWILAGDNPYKGAQAERWKRIGREVFAGQPHAPVTTHPTGMNWPWEDWREEKWLDILGYQSGHGDDGRTLQWNHSGPAAQHWAKGPRRPIINLEPPYEDHLAYQSRKAHSAHNVRRSVYWSLLCTPTAGVTYGGHGLWSWQTQEGKTPPDHPYTGPAKTWRQALDLPGSRQMKHMAALFMALPWWQLRPAPELLVEQPGRANPAHFVAVAASAKRDVALAYLPIGGAIALQAEMLSKNRAEWFDPRTGQRRPAQAAAPGRFEAPSTDDWVLVLRK